MKGGSRKDSSEGPFLWARGIAARETLRYLDRRGIDAGPLLSKAELSRAQVSEESAGVSVASQCRFLDLAAIETDDTLLGLHVAAEMDVRESGILFYLVASSGTVAEALKNLARYVGTTNEAVHIDLSRQSPETVLTVQFAFDEPRRQSSEFSTLAALRVLSRATNRDFAPSRITFAHPRNSELRQIHRLLRCPVEFSHPVDSWVLPQSIMELPIVSSDGHLLEILETHADHLLAERRKVMGLSGMVENRLLGALPSGKVQTAALAQQLGMSMRSFTRRLAAEGTSYGEILDRLRNRLALRYLEDERISLQQIAWLLGYSESAAFSHAFKRWFGTSPNRARLQTSLSDPV